MHTQDMFIPFFCKNCGLMVLLHKKAITQELAVLELNRTSWKPHQCFNAKGDKIWSHQPEISSLEWGVTKIPVTLPTKSKKSRHNQLTLGIVIELPQSSEDKQQAFFRIFTLEGFIIQLRVVEEPVVPSTGIFIDLASAKKIGTGKFRVNQLIHVTPKIEEAEYNEDINKFFSFKVSASDQEQLESFIDRFIQMLSQKNLHLVSITPLKNLPETDSSIYQRQVTAPSAYRLQEAIANMAFPESIRISLQ